MHITTLGICVGASSVSAVQLEFPSGTGEPAEGGERTKFRPTVTRHTVQLHGGNPSRCLNQVLTGFDLPRIDRFAATGRQFRHFINLSTISEPEAVELAYRYCRPAGIASSAVVSCGGETFMAYVLDSHGRIADVLTGNKCAAGTGEFFTQQLKRMKVRMEETSKWSEAVTPYPVSGRCSVFCKSDCTHAVNKGIPKIRVAAGLSLMMAAKITELITNIRHENIMLVGGCTRNRKMVEYLKRNLPGLIIPESATYFEALGAALRAGSHPSRPFPGGRRLLKTRISSFDTLPSLQKYRKMVEFKSLKKDRPGAGDTCILGLDVGSTTTKAVLTRHDDNAILASVYLYTYGDPVAACRACYARLLEQVTRETDGRGVAVVGLGVCGSGRQIAGLHALTDGLVNEIIAHSEAAVYFDPRVDTLFEIGGQDAKYTYITNGVPSAYAMNEACSAGTGSFLAESAEEILGVEPEQIAAIALNGDKPPNFNDQCAAFIASDIKRAVHEGTGLENLVAGLVYSICLNYINRVKGNRPVGEKIFMQGGVCYNHAVPLAMAAVCGRRIVVPPEPGLMGAFGAALEIKKRINQGRLEKKDFDLSSLAARDILYKDSFTCPGGGKQCDRGCEITTLELEGKKYPFGGACNLYYNLRHQLDYDHAGLDSVRLRERMVFKDFAPPPVRESGPRRRIGINRSFMVATYYPFYAAFFHELGCAPILPETIRPEETDRSNAAFCYSAQLAHGYFSTLLHRQPPLDYIFLPRLRGIPASDNHHESQTCPFVQAEPYYLSTTYRKTIADRQAEGTVILQPYLNLTGGLEQAKPAMLAMARQMGIAPGAARKAFAKALARQQDCFAGFKRAGKNVLASLNDNPDQFIFVLFGRPYNAFLQAANMNISHKIASRGIPVIPMDFLPYAKETSRQHMYWGMGQRIIQAARLVKKHARLFPVYITNFSCGVDSFLISYFRDIMEDKPSLTLELDSHTADAGIETRIEAFQEVVAAYLQTSDLREAAVHPQKPFLAARTVIEKQGPRVISSSGEILSMTDPRVKLLIPSMGRLTTELMAAVFRQAGFQAVETGPADEALLKLGRSHTSGKECLPLVLTTGKLLDYVYRLKQDNEVLVYFMPSASGPCRFGQYSVFIQDLIRKLQLPDVAVLSPVSNNFYSGIESRFNYYRAWRAIVIADMMEDIRSMILANARKVGEGIKIFETQWQRLITEMEHGRTKSLIELLEKTALALSAIPLRKPPAEVPKIMLSGEIFVRRDTFSRQHLTEKLANRGFAVKCSPISEWIYYLHYNAGVNREDHLTTPLERLKMYLQNRFIRKAEDRIQALLAPCGLIADNRTDIETIVKNAADYISPKLSGEAILTVGGGLAEVASHVAGVIVIGPFGCMPHRISESIMNEVMTGKDKLQTGCANDRLRSLLKDVERLPFLAIETDGSPYPQLIEARLEAFCLQARRLHEKMMTIRPEKS